MHLMTTHEKPAALVWRMEFTAQPKCVRLVRQQVGRALTRWGYGKDDIASVVMVCSELATNAVQHTTGGPFTVQVTAGGSHCLIQVTDPGEGTPSPRTPASDEEHGRGLQLVAALAEEIGYHPHEPFGKTVWARLATEGAAPVFSVATTTAGTPS